MSENELISILSLILKDEYKTHINDWLFYAKPNDKKGLYLISKIYKHQGSAVFKEKPIKQMSTDLNDLNYKAAMMRYKNNSFSSSYKSSFPPRTAHPAGTRAENSGGRGAEPGWRNLRHCIP